MKLAERRLPAPVICSRHDRGIAGNVLADIAAEQPRIGVIAAADAVADDQRDVAALVEIFDAGGAGQAGDNDER